MCIDLKPSIIVLITVNMKCTELVKLETGKVMYTSLDRLFLVNTSQCLGKLEILDMNTR